MAMQQINVQTRQLGNTDIRISPLGFGARAAGGEGRGARG
jgi:aryl-alcohol dehydrogenase-like predicted oxidoreductase